MSLGTLGSTLNDELNRLANGGTYRDMNQMVDEALAAKQWANRENIIPYSTDTVGILNEIAGLGLDKKNWLDFNGVCNYIAGTTGLPAAAALRQVYPTTDLLTSQASYYVDAYAGTNYIPTTASGFMYLPGTAGNYASAPDSAALDITGDIDLRTKVAMDNWIPSTQMVFIAKWNPTGNQLSYQLRLTTEGRLLFTNSSNGSTVNINATSTASVPFANGEIGWVRATFATSSGDVVFYTSTNGTTWTQLGTTIAGTGAVTMFSGTALLEVGARTTGTQENARGKFYQATIYSDLTETTKVFDANFATAMTAQTVTSFTESSTNAATVTIARTTLDFPLNTINNLGTAGSLLPTTVGSSTAADSNDPKFLDHTGTNYVYLPGVASNRLSVPDADNLDILGDLDLRAYIAMDSWTPSANQFIIAKAGSASTWSYGFRVTATTGVLTLILSADGTTTGTYSSTVAPGLAAGTAKWVRVTRDAAGATIKFYTSDDGTTWTQLGSDVTGAITDNLFVTTSAVEFGTVFGGSAAPLAGKIFRAQIYNGIDGTTVLDVDTSTLTTGADAYIVPVTYTGQAGAFFTGTGLSLPGTAGNYVTTPDSSAFDITGDLDLRCNLALTDWTAGSSQTVIGRWGTSTKAYMLQVNGTGNLVLYWSNDGSATISKTSTAAITTADGSPTWVRATLDVNNGASGNDVNFYTSSDGVTWTQLGNTVTTAGVTSIFASTNITEIGSWNGGGSNLANGTFYRAQVLSGIDGWPVFDATFVGVLANSLRMTESSTNRATVSLVTTRYCTINRSTSGRKTVAVTQPTWLFGTDDYMEVNNRYMSSGTYLYLPGIAGNSASTPDAAVLDITGDIDLRAKVAMDDWTPSAAQVLVAKRNNGTANVSYQLVVQSSGSLALGWTTNGSTFIGVNSTVVTGLADGSTKWVRGTLDVDNGAGGYDVKFYTSDDGTNWTQLGTTVTGGSTTSIFSSNAALEIGITDNNFNSPARGKFFRAQVLNGIDGTVAFDANFETSITSLLQTSFTESSTNAATVTINRSGSTYRSAGITAAGYLYPGATNTFSASATDFLNFGAADSFTLLAVVRQWNTPTSFGKYLIKRAAPGPGYSLETNGTALDTGFAISDGTNTPYNNSLSNFVNGSLLSFAGVRNVSSDTLIMYNNTDNVSITDTTTATISNIQPFRLSNVTGSGPQDFELVGAAVFRSLLTTAQIRQITNYFANREVYL